jgi:hypothetical protein
LLGEILNTPGLADRLFEALHPGFAGTLARTSGSRRQKP